MNTEFIYECYKRFLPNIGSYTEEWYPMTDESIIVYPSKSLQCIFTYKNDKNWSLETASSYIDRLTAD